MSQENSISMNDIGGCTIVTRAQIAFARVLAKSFRRATGNARFAVLVLDAEEHGWPDEGIQWLNLYDVGWSREEADRWALCCEAPELAALAKPRLLKALLEQFGGMLFYFAPTIEIYGRLERFAEFAHERAIVLVPRGDDAGIFDPEVFRIGPGSENVLSRWVSQLESCGAVPDEIRAREQRWFDSIPATFSSFAIWRDEAANVSHRNLAMRNLTLMPHGYEVNGSRLSFFNFDGFDPDSPYLLVASDYAPAISLSENPVLLQLTAEYREGILQAGFNETKSLPWRFGTTATGVRIDAPVRRFYAAAWRSGEQLPEPFSSAKAAADFMAWLNGSPRGVSPDVSRYMLAVHAARRDLRESFADPAGADAERFASWMRGYGYAEENTPDAFRRAPAAKVEPRRSNLAVSIIGYFNAELGVGEVARRLSTALCAAGVEHDRIACGDTFSRQQHEFATDAIDEPGAIVILCINPNELLRFAERRGPVFFRERYVIGVWFWEVDEFPEALHPAFDFVDEVWAASEFMQRTFERVSPRPVHHLPLPLAPASADGGAITRESLGLPPDRFVFLFSFDFLSVCKRKNPLGLIDAFRQAFRPDEGASLVIKTMNGDKRLRYLEELRYAASGREDIIVHDGYLSPVEHNALMSQCDCYVSLHRSEGFGLTIADAMSLGRPVIATAYSGNLDLTTAENSFLCSFDLVPVGPGAEPYPQSAHWAEPKIKEAAQLLRRVFEDREEAAKRAARAIDDMQSSRTPRVAGESLKARLHEINTALRAATVQPADKRSGLSDREWLNTIEKQFSIERGAARQRIMEDDERIAALSSELTNIRSEITAVSDARAKAESESREAHRERERLRHQIDKLEAALSMERVRYASVNARLQERDAELKEVVQSGVWKTVKPLWKLGRHFRKAQAATPAESAESEFAFAVDAPLTWEHIREVVLVRGWCLAIDGQPLTGVRAVLGKKSRLARYELKREDVAAFFPTCDPAAHSGFAVEVRVPVGTHSLKLQAIRPNGRWQTFFEHDITRLDAAAAAASSGAPPMKIDWTPLTGWSPAKILRYLEPRLREHAERAGNETPLISVITPTFNTTPYWLGELAESLLDQSNPRWEWCIVDDGSTKRELRKMLERFAEISPRVRIRFAQKLGIAEATNQALDMARGEYVCFVDHDDLIDPRAIELLSAKMVEGYDAVYSDEDKLEESSGECVDAFFKPDWSPEYFRGVMYVGHLLCVRRSLASKVRFDSAFDGVQDYEFMLRVSETGAKIGHLAELLYHWRKVPGSIAAKSDAKRNIGELQKRAVNGHLSRINLPAVAERSELPHRLQIIPAPRKKSPRVSIIIPTRDAPELLGRCLESIAEKTSYPEFEVVIVDNETTDAKALKLMEEYPVRRVPFPSPFNFSRANNLGAAAAGGDFLLFLNNDTEIVTSDWLQHMLYYADQPDVGAVGALLVYEDKTIQHAGVTLGIRGTADHAMRGFPMGIDGYAGNLACAREVSAVTAACMMIRRSLFDSIGGFNEHFFTAYQDLDLCLRIRARGLRIIYTPRALVVHHESLSRKDYYDMVDRMLLLDQWESVIERGDPYYNRNLTVDDVDYSRRVAA